MRYPLYDLDDLTFEYLVTSICEDILGIGTVIFSPGKDGGRDGKFNGTANNFPSTSEPWKGKIIIQSKFTNKVNASCSDSDFTTIIDDEIKKVKSMKDNGEIDYYIIFTNRRLSGIKDNTIENKINSTGVTNCLIGEERIQKYLQDYPKTAKKHNLNSLLLPLDFREEDLVDIINAFSNTNFDNPILNKELLEIDKEIKKIPIEEKNYLNNLRKDYYEDVMKKSFEYFSKIGTFLKNPDNSDFIQKYYDTIGEINEIISIKRDEYTYFDELFVCLYRYVISSNTWEPGKKRYVRFFLHYMYWMCHIGKS